MVFAGAFFAAGLEAVLRTGLKRYPQVQLRTSHEVIGIEAGEQQVTLQVKVKGSTPTETVQARYVVGCDGAHSAVRKAIGGQLHGDAALPHGEDFLQFGNGQFLLLQQQQNTQPARVCNQLQSLED